MMEMTHFDCESFKLSSNSISIYIINKIGYKKRFLIKVLRFMNMILRLIFIYMYDYQFLGINYIVYYY